MIWIIILIPALVGIMAFSLNSGQYEDDIHQVQTVADSAVMAGVNALRRVFEEETSTMSAVCKAGFISEAVNDALTRMASEVVDGGMGYSVDGVELIYCPRSSEQLISGGGPCYVIPADADCDVECNCGSFAGSIATYTNVDTDDKPGNGFYPLDSEVAGSGADEEDSAGYVYVQINKDPTTYFPDVMGILNTVPIVAEAMGRHRFKPASSCPGLFNPQEGGNDPKPLDLKNNSTLKITNGGITISDDVTNDIHSSSPPNYIYADWIKILNNYSGQITYYCGPEPYTSCIPEIVTSQEIAAYEPPDGYLRAQEVQRKALCTVLTSSCTPRISPSGGYIYDNCNVTKSMVTASGGRYELYAGTYCGGLKITEVGGTAAAPAVVLKPRMYDDKIDDVIYLVSDDLEITGAPGKGKDPKAPSFVEVWNNNIEDGGLIIYAAADDVKKLNVELKIGWFIAPGDNDQPDRGSLRIHADNLVLDDSRLEFRTYIDGERCTGNNEEIPLVSGLVQ